MSFQLLPRDLSLWIKHFSSIGMACLSFTTTWYPRPSTSICSLTPPPPLISEVFYQGCWFASTWPPEPSQIPQIPALFKLYPLVVAAALWSKGWSASIIVMYCDNKAIVHCINSGRSHSPTIMPFLRRLIWIANCDEFVLTARHISGSKNQIADALSHFALQKFRLLAPDADPLPTPVPPYSELIFQ